MGGEEGTLKVGNYLEDIITSTPIAKLLCAANQVRSSRIKMWLYKLLLLALFLKIANSNGISYEGMLYIITVSVLTISILSL